MSARSRGRVFVDELPKTHDVRYGLLFLVALVINVLALYAIGFFVAGDKLPSGTSIAGVDVGGMTHDQAVSAVQDELAPRIEQPLTVLAARHTYSIDPQQAGLAFDIDASITAAMHGSSWDPRHMLHVLMGGQNVQPALVVDQAELDATLRRIAGDVSLPARNAAVSFATGDPQVRFGHTGQQLDWRRAQARLIAAVRTGTSRVVMPVTAVQPDVTDDEADTFASTVGTRAVKGDVALRVAGSTITLHPSVFAPSLTTRVTDSDLRLAVNSQRLYARSRAALASIPHAPVNATIQLRDNRPVVVHGRRGTAVSAQNWADAVLTAVSRDSRRDSVSTSSARPAVTTADVRKLAVRTRIASSSVSSTVSNADLARAAGQVNGTLLKPGDTLSFLDTVDARRSVPAASAVAGATYNAAFRAGLTVLQRTPPTYDTNAYPTGLGARVTPPAQDLVLRNDSPYGVYLAAKVKRSSKGGGQVSVDVWSSPYWQIKLHTSKQHSVVKPQTQVISARHCSPRRGIAGFAVDVTRVFSRSGKRVDSDVTHTSYAPLNAIKCR